MPYFEDIHTGKKPFEFRINDRNYQVGDEIHHIEFDNEKKEPTGRECWTTVKYIIHGPAFGIPTGYCIFTQHFQYQTDFIRDYDGLANNILPRYEEKLSYKMGGNIVERMEHVLKEFNSAAVNSIWKVKNFMDDVKTQFKALEIVVEGLTSEAYNHGQKRTIGNHVINMLRGMVDKIDRVNWDYSNSMYERYNYFRSDSPEGDLMKRYRELKDQNERLKQEFKNVVTKLPEDQQTDLPF